MDEVGIVTSSEGYLINLEGLPTARINDIIENEDGQVRGWVSGLNNHVEAFLVDEADIKPGAMFRKTNRSLTIQTGDFLLGRAVNPFGLPIDGKGLLRKTADSASIKLDSQAPDMTHRQIIDRQFDTGVIITDTLIPIGRGQRELVMGDARSGKSSFLVSTVINQKSSGVICIYAAIGKSITDIRNMIDTLDTNKALSYSVIIAASSTDPAPLIFLAPQAAFAVAEYFQSQGKDVFVILDDMGNHAKIYREMSLLSSKVPGRESYPGDIFYQHAHLMERAGKFRPEAGGGSITAMPVIELNLNDFTTLIPTNLMAMTDGHLLFKSALYNQGQRPAIDISLSVSRVGLQTQAVIQKILGSKLKALLSQANQVKTLQSFSGELSSETQLIQKQSHIVEELIKQEELTNIPKQIQITLLFLAFSKFLTEKDISFVSRFKSRLIQGLTVNPELRKTTEQVLKCQDEKEVNTLLEKVTPILEGICR